MSVELAVPKSGSAAASAVLRVGGGTVRTSRRDDGLAEFQAAGSLSRIRNYYMVAFALAEQAWVLFEPGAIAMPGTRTS